MKAGSGAPSPRALARRLLAAGIDAVLITGVALLLAEGVGRFVAERAALTLRVGAPDGPWTGGVPLVLGVTGQVSYAWPLIACALLVAEPLWGATAGKALMRIAVDPRGAAHRWLRWVTKTTPLLALSLAILSGRWPLFVLALALTVAWFLAQLVCLLWAHRALHDVVVRQGLPCDSDRAERLPG